MYLTLSSRVQLYHVRRRLSASRPPRVQTSSENPGIGHQRIALEASPSAPALEREKTWLGSHCRPANDLCGYGTQKEAHGFLLPPQVSE